MQELAVNIDKALNSSFGQTNSTTQHVYRITLCKGIPYYGYHSNEHQFFRIELYNPNLIKRTANLLQSGTVMGRILQPHESHIPYVLKFFIDFNLFGMSYIHVPIQKVHNRFSDESRFKKRSVSQLEVDFNACYILNRATLAQIDESKNANAGIESIWEDERRRRAETFSQDVPELKTQQEEFRECPPTSSNDFFMRALESSLLTSANDSINQSDFDSTFKRKFNMKHLLDASNYAVELSQSSESSGSSKTNLNESQSVEELENLFMNIDGSEKSCKSSREDLNQSINQNLTQLSDDKSDDEDESEFNMTLADLEADFLNNFEESEAFSEKFPQLDGADDEVERNFHPEPGPSRCKKESVDILNNSYIQDNLRSLAIEFGCYEAKKEIKKEEISDDELQMSYFDQTFNDFEEVEDLKNEMDIEDSENVTIVPLVDPPEPSSVIENLVKYEIPSVVNPIAFYGDPSDITDRKEVGRIILEVPGNKLNDCDNFKSVLYNSSQIDLFQGLKIKHNLGFVPKQVSTKIELINNENYVIIQSMQEPPNYNDAKDWLESFDVKENVLKELDESPVKMKREKTLMVLEIDENSEDLDKTLVPETPGSSKLNDTTVIESSIEKDINSPQLTEYIEDDIYLSYSARKKRKRKMKQSFSKRFQEIMKSKVSMENVNSPQSSIMSESSEDMMKDFPDDPFDPLKESQDSSEQTFDSSLIINANNPEGQISNESELLSNTFGFKVNLESLGTNDEHTDLTILSMELHVQTQGEFKPNPETDEISAIFYSLEGLYVNGVSTCRNGIIVKSGVDIGYTKEGISIQRVETEQELLEIFFRKIRLYDPDILAGYEIELQSWGYLIERGYVLNLNFCNALSRMPLEKDQIKKPIIHNQEEDEHDQGDYYTEQKIPGRILLDVWRLMRHEIALTSYTFENISYHILHRRYPKHSYSTLTNMWNHPLKMWIVADYYMTRAITLLEILRQLDLVGRTCELAKLFGIQFYEVLSRGSQFRVESMMLRIARRRNFVPVSPSMQQRVHMRAPEYIPLILEPESRFYTDPVIVLDFQSLYPSMMIAYNYCFSTCLGRIEHLTKWSNQPFEFGAYQFKISPSKLQQLLEKKLITVSPCGVAFVKQSVREGTLPRMLKEILDTRFMVKQSMKLYKNNTALQRVLHSRQLGLKLMANVTYGYTAANMNGRMPCVEVGDSVVSKGRETLERAISLVEKNEKWRCKVCYGDTDSMFVLVPGRTREEAFKIGEEIAEAVTNQNPHPVKLKLEKVYQPCILQTKKRYVGNMYESADQQEPTFEAKGIEVIRRDGCPSSAKILEKSLKILFDTHDVSKVKEYVCRQFTKILEGKSSIQDLIIAKEFRGISGYKEKACVPALTLTR